MALRDQPYLPLYVQDLLSDEALRECQASSVGVYVYIMCIMHKSKYYGKILLQQKDKQNDQQIKNFAEKLLHHLPYKMLVIESALNDLLTQNVLYIDGDFLCQKRMIKDNSISETRAKSGSEGGKATSKKHKNFATAKKSAKHVANSEYEYYIDNTIVDNSKEVTNSLETNILREKKEKKSQVLVPERYFPKAEDFNGLPEMHLNRSIEFIKVTQGINVSKDEMSIVWETFKIKHLTGDESYESESRVYRHFLDHIKFIEFKNKKDEKLGTSAARMAKIEERRNSRNQ